MLNCGLPLAVVSGSEGTMKDIKIKDGGEELVDEIEHLWKELNAHHIETSENFSQIFENYTFNKAKGEFFENKDLFVSIATMHGHDVGYCLTGITGDEDLKFGHIESLFVLKEYRCQGIGSLLFKKAMKWLNENEVFAKDITVVHGNNEMVTFYEKHGFKIDTVKMLETF